jgi:hypothetical protein
MKLKKALEYPFISVKYILANKRNSSILWFSSQLYAFIWLILTCLALMFIIGTSITLFITETELASIFLFSAVGAIFFGIPLFILYIPIHYSYKHFSVLEDMLIQKELNDKKIHDDKKRQIEEMLIQKKNELNDKKRQFLSTIIESENYDLIVSFASKYGLNYTKSDLENLNKLLKSRGIERDLNTSNGLINFDFELDLDTTAKLIQDEVKKQEYNNYKNRIFQSNPFTKNDFLSVYLNIYGKSLYELQKFNGVLNEDGFEPLLGIEIINAFKKMELELFEKRLKADENYQDANVIDQMNGYDFEHFVKKLFENMGYSVEHTPLSGDQGADLIVTKFGEKTSIQVKRYSGNVSNSSVQEVVASKNYYNSDKCMVVTNSYFTNSAVELARANSVELINRDKLFQLIDRYM